tara:strand:+ start:1766 stop:1972 length:207 start_codon:yes stop_codon:yes gene_type:complete
MKTFIVDVTTTRSIEVQLEDDSTILGDSPGYSHIRACNEAMRIAKKQLSRAASPWRTDLTVSQFQVKD